MRGFICHPPPARPPAARPPPFDRLMIPSIPSLPQDFIWGTQEGARVCVYPLVRPAHLPPFDWILLPPPSSLPQDFIWDTEGASPTHPRHPPASPPARLHLIGSFPPSPPTGLHLGHRGREGARVPADTAGAEEVPRAAGGDHQPGGARRQVEGHFEYFEYFGHLNI